jgi:Flp pilus assembly protein TadD
MPEQVKKSLVLWIYFALAVSTLLVFWQVRNFGSVDYDDNAYVFKNPHVLNGLTKDSVKWAFTTGYAGNWSPLIWLSYMLDRQLFGNNAGGYHITNLIFHIANTLLLFFVLKQMTGALWQSAFVAALFAIHPFHVEAVTWVSSRKDVLSTFFWMLAMAVYMRYVKQPSGWRYLLVLLFFAMGLMAKAMVVTLPFVLLLLDYWPLDRIKRVDWKTISQLVLEKIPFIVLAAVFSVITFFTQQHVGALPDFHKFVFKYRVYNAFVSYIKYIEKMIWPSGLAVCYPHPYEKISVLFALISAILLLVVTILVLRFANKHRYLVTGWFWYLGTLVPVIGLVQIGGHAMADRYTYITLTGLFIIIAWGLPDLLAKWPNRKIALGLSMIIVLTTLGICAGRQVSYWSDRIVLFSHALAVTQNNYIAYNSRGVAYDSLGRYPEAMEDFKQALRIRPDYAEAYNSCGVTYNSLGRYPEAMENFEQAIKNKPGYAEAHNNLGAAYGNLGRYPEAIEAFRQAVKINPDYADAYYNLGNAYSKLRRRQDAIEAYRQAVKINPNYAEAHNNLGYSYLAIGDKNSAMTECNILKYLNSKMANNLFRQINK